MVVAILGYILPPLDEELCIKIKETVQILKLNYSDIFFTK